MRVHYWPLFFSNDAQLETEKFTILSPLYLFHQESSSAADIMEGRASGCGVGVVCAPRQSLSLPVLPIIGNPVP